MFGLLAALILCCLTAAVKDSWATNESCQPHSARDHTLFIFSHIPKAGGSSFGAFLQNHFKRSFQADTTGSGLCPLHTCHLVHVNSLFKRNYDDQCGGKSSERVPNFSQCGFFWAQHLDLSVLSQLAAEPRYAGLRVAPMVYARRPADAVVSLFHYMKYLAPQQQHRRLRAKKFAHFLEHTSLTEWVEKEFLSCGAGKAVGPLTQFLAGASGWASCPVAEKARCARSLANAQELAAAAAANVGRMAFLGVTEMPAESQALLEAALGLPKGAGQLGRVNENKEPVAPEDMPTEALLSTLNEALRLDNELYALIVRRVTAAYRELSEADRASAASGGNGTAAASGAAGGRWATSAGAVPGARGIPLSEFGGGGPRAVDRRVGLPLPPAGAAPPGGLSAAASAAAAGAPGAGAPPAEARAQERAQQERQWLEKLRSLQKETIARRKEKGGAEQRRIRARRERQRGGKKGKNRGGQSAKGSRAGGGGRQQRVGGGGAGGRRGRGKKAKQPKKQPKRRHAGDGDEGEHEE